MFCAKDDTALVVDTKHNRLSWPITGASTYHDQILKNGNPYQRYTCLRSQERAEATTCLTTDGMSLHPQTGGSVDEAMRR